MRTSALLRGTTAGLLASAAVAAAGVTFATAGDGPDPPSIAALDQRPVAALSADAQAALGAAADQGFAPREDAARTIPAPSGKGEPWVLTETADGGLCAVIDGAGACDDGAAIRSGAFGVVSVEIPEAVQRAARAESERSADGRALLSENPDVSEGRATRQGVVPDGVTSVVALGGDGAPRATAPVRANGYELDLGAATSTKAVSLRRADGSEAARYTLTW